MSGSSFTPGIQLSLEAGADPRFAGARVDDVELWRQQLRPIAWTDRASRKLSPDARPSPDKALEELSLAFGNHPLCTTARIPGRDSSQLPDVDGKAFVIAEILLLPDLGPIPPGGEVPTVNDTVGPAVLVHQVTWPHELDSDAGQAAARDLLTEVANGLPRERWILG